MDVHFLNIDTHGQYCICVRDTLVFIDTNLKKHSGIWIIVAEMPV